MKCEIFDYCIINITDITRRRLGYIYVAVEPGIIIIKR